MLFTCLIRFSNKVRILSDYLHILMENSPSTFQTLYLWLNINTPNQHFFIGKCKILQVALLLSIHVTSWSRRKIGKLIRDTQNIKKSWECRSWNVRKKKEDQNADTPFDNGKCWLGAALFLCSDWQILLAVLRYPITNWCAPLRFIDMIHKTGDWNATLRRML